MYDPHLAPVIEAFIEQQRELHRRHHPVAVSVDRSEGRSSALPASALRQRHPAELYELDESMAEVHRAPVSYTPRRRKPVPPLEEGTPRDAAPVPTEAVPLISIEKDLPAPPVENPFADAADRSPSPPLRSPRPALRSLSPALSPTVSPMPSSAPSVASPALSHTTLIEAPSSPGSMSDDIDIVSVSGTNTSYIDAESYTPRSLSPSPGSRAASRPLTPALGSAMAGSELAFPSPVTPMLGSDLTFPSPNVGQASHTSPAPSGRASPRADARADDVISVSSWTEDEWRSEADSEWDAVSDAPSR